MNEQDLKILTNIQKTLEVDPNANQRILAQNSNVSLGMMNAVLKRCVERGWLAVKNLNMKKVCYCLTADGFNEISKRSSNYMKRSFSMMNDYADKIQNIIIRAKEEGKNKVVLYGNSNVRFVLEWACQKNGIEFIFCSEDDKINSNNSLNLAGECMDEKELEKLLQKGCKSVMELVR